MDRKVKIALDRRVKDWDSLVATGMQGTRTKLVKLSETTAAFHKPGSQNRKKGRGKRSVGR